MSENTEGQRTEANITGSFEAREGAQVISTIGLPANYEPPSAALIQPAAAEPAPQPNQGD